MRRAILNITENAIKYGGCAEVELASSDGLVRLAISDRGSGIPADKVELAFQAFSRLEQSRSRETGGVGLGLAIARDIITAHGGRIDLQERQGGGLVAVVQLPASMQLS